MSWACELCVCECPSGSAVATELAWTPRGLVVLLTFKDVRWGEEAFSVVVSKLALEIGLNSCF